MAAITAETKVNISLASACAVVVIGGGLLWNGANMAAGYRHANLVIAAVEAGLALGMVMLLYRQRSTLDAQAWSVMRG